LVVVNVMISVPGEEGVTGWKICRNWAIKDEQDREFKGNDLGAKKVYYGIYPGEKPIKGFPSTGVTPGLPRTGNVFFEVPKDSEKLKLKVGSHRWK